MHMCVYIYIYVYTHTEAVGTQRVLSILAYLFRRIPQK